MLGGEKGYSGGINTHLADYIIKINMSHVRLLTHVTSVLIAFQLAYLS